jgi:toxin ParE1/3/4
MAAATPQPRIRPLAAQDLEEIVRYLDERSSIAADRFIEEFLRSALMLAEMPRLGPVRRTRGELKGLRSWPLTNFGPYVLFYLPTEDSIDVVRVFHGARDVDRELKT